MRASKVRLYIRVRLRDGRSIYTDPVWNRNRTLREGYAAVDASPECHPEGIYYLRYLREGKRGWQAVGANADAAVVALHNTQHNLQAVQLGHTPTVLTPASAKAEDASSSCTLADAIEAYLSEVRRFRAPKTIAACERILPAARIRALAEVGYLERAEPVLLVGGPGTGKSHLATGLAITACRQRRRVRFVTAAGLVNQLVEAQREHSLSRVLARWSRVELIVIDELGYVPLAEVAAELLFQVIAERAENAAIIVTTNLPFSELPQVFTNARLCKAMLDRLTDRAHIIETGSESYRFQRTLRKKEKD